MAHWTPRVLSLLFVGFLSIFALDVFTGPFEPIMIAWFLIHLLPSFALLALTFIAWRHPLVGTFAYIGFAFLYVLLVGLDRPWSWYALISGPSFIIGILYLADWFTHRPENIKTYA